jgi:TatD DNase family protein
VTYRANDELRAALRAVPVELVLVETDAPYLTPHPFRGRPNAPYVVAHTVRAMAEILERPLDEVCAAVSATSERVYGPW